MFYNNNCGEPAVSRLQRPMRGFLSLLRVRQKRVATISNLASYEVGALVAERHKNICNMELQHMRYNPVTPKRFRPECGARCRDGHSCRAKAVWDYRHDEPRNGRCRMHGGLSSGPRRRKDGSPARVRKSLEDCRPGAAEIKEGDYIYDIQALIRIGRLRKRIRSLKT